MTGMTNDGDNKWWGQQTAGTMNDEDNQGQRTTDSGDEQGEQQPMGMTNRGWTAGCLAGRLAADSGGAGCPCRSYCNYIKTGCNRF